ITVQNSSFLTAVYGWSGALLARGLCGEGSLWGGAVDVAAACVPCRRPGGTVRDCGCRDLVPPASFLKAGPRRDGRRPSRGTPIGHFRRLGAHRASGDRDSWGDGEFT